ncbi:hypothetical protein CERSUDRAFT_117611 [Gelatoporia subvermispora B]|uniref:SPT2 chromatin protein n=1 Tax=Ceriporiopsis subvermispora (strain B) TaxID=914234 RepID=M2QPK7_CERS8|nr:hypothetical protein CERSUDRAFT_117611 [Gelatoporia subvermispora B]
MSNFAALMALSATQTRQSEAVVQNALAERQRKEAERRKQQEAREKRERELEAKLRAKKLEEQKREQERQARYEKEKQARERELQRKEEEQRNNLRYGPKRTGGGYPTSSAAPRRKSSDDEEGGAALTREEKRKRRMEAELRYGANSHRRASQASGYRRHGKVLPGGAVDITTTSTGLSSDPSSSQSVKARIAAEPAMLIKLNVNKRDTRTIDEILQDREKARAEKVLQGDDARHFNDWFSDKKKAAATTPSTTSRANTPAAPTASQAPARAPSGSASPATASPAPPKLPSFSKSSAASTSASKALPAKASGASTPRMPPPKHSAPDRKPAIPGSRLTVTSTSKVGTATPPGRPLTKKRPRSPSRSLSPAPSNKRRAVTSQQNSLSHEIWKMFGKDRSQYVNKEIFSDDEDMEAGASDLEREEDYSARHARREDELALAEERRHEEEKRRKKKERDMREKRG